MLLYKKAYNFVERAKYFLHVMPVDNKFNGLADKDADVLHAMYQDAGIKKSTDGNDYWYYVTPVHQEMELARKLFARNGIRTQGHYSGLNDGMHTVLRIPAKDITENMDAFLTNVTRRDRKKEDVLKARQQIPGLLLFFKIQHEK